MSQDNLFAPWRMAWVTRDREADGGCVLCAIDADSRNPENRVVARGANAFVVVNNAPYNPGHCMIVPADHVGDLTDLHEDALSELITMQRDTVAVLTDVFAPEGFNIGMNIGEAAGASVSDHIHVHVIPRWGSDTTFMSTAANTNVIAEALDETYERLDTAFDDYFG